MSKLKESNKQEKMNCIDSEKEKINDELLEKDSDIKPRTPEQEAFACEMREFLQSLVDMGMEDCEDEDIYDSDEDIAE